MTPDKTTLDILLVEDDGIVAMLIEDMLIDLGHRTIGTAGKIELAMEYAAVKACSFAILDLNLNGQNTFPVAKILAERGVPFIFATGYGPSGLPEEWKDVPTISKPFLTNALSDAMARAIESQTAKS